MALAEIFNTRSKSRILQLKNQLQSFRKNNLSADDYVARLTTMAEELREAGVAIDDGELSLIALNGFNAIYDPVVTTQVARIEDISFSFFLGLLCAYESRLQRTTDDCIATGNITQSDTSNTILVCQICNKRGQSAIACFNRHNEQRFPTQ